MNQYHILQILTGVEGNIDYISRRETTRSGGQCNRPKMANIINVARKHIIIINRFLSCHCVLSIDQSSRIFVWVWCHRNLYIDQLFPEMIAIIHSVKYSICQPTGRWCLPSLCGKMVWVLRLWIFAVMLLIHH